MAIISSYDGYMTDWTPDTSAVAMWSLGRGADDRIVRALILVGVMKGVEKWIPSPLL